MIFEICLACDELKSRQVTGNGSQHESREHSISREERCYQETEIKQKDLDNGQLPSPTLCLPCRRTKVILATSDVDLSPP